MMPVSHKLQIYNSVTKYECDSCGQSVEVQPLSSIGILVSVGAMVIAFIAYIAQHGSGSFEVPEFVFLMIVLSLLAFVTVPPLLVHWVYPKCKPTQAVTIEQDTNTKNHLLAKPISWLEKSGFIFGLLTPILLIALVLGAATLIGYINYTFFGN